MPLYQLELAGSVTPEVYEEAIPKVCAYQTYLAHANGLMLCWGLMSAIEKGHCVNCGDCELVTRNKLLNAVED